MDTIFFVTYFMGRERKTVGSLRQYRAAGMAVWQEAARIHQAAVRYTHEDEPGKMVKCRKEFICESVLRI